MATEERRKDLGLKLVYVILTAIITFLLSIVFFETYRKAEAAVTLSGKNTTDIAVLQEWTKAVNGNLISINGKLDKLLGWNR